MSFVPSSPGFKGLPLWVGTPARHAAARPDVRPRGASWPKSGMNHTETLVSERPPLKPLARFAHPPP